MTAFPREDILFLRTEDYVKDPAAVLLEVMAHLGLSEASQELLQKMVAQPVRRPNPPTQSDPVRSGRIRSESGPNPIRSGSGSDRLWHRHGREKEV